MAKLNLKIYSWCKKFIIKRFNLLNLENLKNNDN